jgi:hypothetical protein
MKMANKLSREKELEKRRCLDSSLEEIVYAAQTAGLSDEAVGEQLLEIFFSACAIKDPLAFCEKVYDELYPDEPGVTTTSNVVPLKTETPTAVKSDDEGPSVA